MEQREQIACIFVKCSRVINKFEINNMRSNCTSCRYCIVASCFCNSSCVYKWPSCPVLYYKAKLYNKEKVQKQKSYNCIICNRSALQITNSNWTLVIQASTSLKHPLSATYDIRHKAVQNCHENANEFTGKYLAKKSLSQAPSVKNHY
jgi:hypothetical protein